MVMQDDHRLDEAKAIPIREVADKLGISGLKPAGHELIGPCPVCGGRDRFSINSQRGVFNCRRECGGGDGLKLVQIVLGVDFPAALSWLVGDRQVQIDPAEVERRRRKAAEAERKANEIAERARKSAIAAARKIWSEGVSPEGTAVREYLSRRGIPSARLAELPRTLRFHPALPYMVSGDGRGEWIEIHRGPAMLAAIHDRTDTVNGVHRTWLDLSQPKGKAVLEHKGDSLKAKKTLGHKKGGAIRLLRRGQSGTMIMGEGIETTLTAAIADERDAAFWAGIDLGNMSGKRVLRGQGMKFAGIPDLDDPEAFLPPPWVRHLIYIQDGDSDPKSTRAQLLSGLRRARACVPGLDRISIVHAGEGRDLNDILLSGGEE